MWHFVLNNLKTIADM